MSLTHGEIMDVFDGLQDQDPDISTEKLIQLTMDMVPCTHDELFNALKLQKDGCEAVLRKVKSNEQERKNDNSS